MGSRSREPYYRALPFHAVRFLSLLSSSIVAGILVFFCVSLKHDGFKLPWAVLIVLATVLGTLIYLLLSWCVNSCGTFSPLFSLIVNIPILLVWIGAFSFFTYNIYGTLGHSCSISGWGNSAGVKVCNVYKILYAFMLFGLLSHVALIVYDVRARRAQTAQGIYNRMREEGRNSLKMDTFEPIRGYTPELEMPYGGGSGRDAGVATHNNTNIYSVPHNPDYVVDTYQSNDTSYKGGHFLGVSRPGLYTRGASPYHSSRSDAPMLGDYGPRWGERQQSAYSSPRHVSAHRY